MQSQSTATIRRDNRLRLVAALLSLAAVSLFAIRGSYAFFSATTDGEDTDYTASTVVLDDDDAASTTTSFDSLVPGDVSTSCIAVTYSGTETDDLDSVVMYFGAGSADALDADLDLVVTEYDSADCTGGGTTVDSGDTVAGVETDHASYGTGLSTSWTPDDNPQTRSFEIEVTFEDDGTDQNALQGLSGGTTVTWEVRTQDTP